MKEINIFGAERSFPHPKTTIGTRAAIMENGKLLLSHEGLGDYWMLPVGGMEDGETPEKCCIREVAEDPISEMLLSGRPHNVSGTCVACIMEGSRPILAEVQVLATKSGFASPRRMTTGFDYNRMAMIVAVLEKRAGLFFGTLDIYVNIVGGFKLDEPAGDLSVALALQSSLLDKPVNEKVIAFGEIGLGGEIRSVSHIPNRIREAERMGFEICIVPKQTLKGINTENYNLKIIGVTNIRQAFAAVNE